MRPINKAFDVTERVILAQENAWTSDSGLLPHIRFAIHSPYL